MPLIDVVIAQVSRGSIPLQHLRCMHGLQDALRAHGLIGSVETLIVPSGENIDKARSIIVSRAYRSGANVVLCIDDDVLFEPEQIVPLVIEAHQRQAVVGAVTAKKKRGEGIAVQFAGPPQSIQFLTGGLVTSCHAMGGSVMAISRKTLAQVACGLDASIGLVNDGHGGEVWPFFLPIIEQQQWLQEDFAFCSRVRRFGGRLFVDTRPLLKHLGAYPYTLLDAAPPAPYPTSVVVQFAGEQHGTPLTTHTPQPKSA